MTTSLATPPDLVKAPVVFVTGKGGVGKTTVAAALAVTSQRGGLRTALVEFDDGQAGARALGTFVAEVAHVVITYDRALLDALGSLLGARLLARAIVSHSAIKRMIRAVPALREFAFMNGVRVLVDERRFDRIVVDLPSSGHAIDWLRVPLAFDRFLGRSPLGILGRRVFDELVAPGRCDVVVVTLAEPLVVKETEELCRRMRGLLDVAPALVVVNRTMTPDPELSWEAARSLASSVSDLSEAAGELVTILEARGDQVDDTSYAFGLARAVDARRVISLPDSASDPPAGLVADWLAAGAVA